MESWESKSDEAKMAITILQRPVAGLAREIHIRGTHAQVQRTMPGYGSVGSIATMEVVQSSVGYLNNTLFNNVLWGASRSKSVVTINKFKFLEAAFTEFQMRAP